MKKILSISAFLFMATIVFGQESQRIIFKVKSEHRLKCQKSFIQLPSLQYLFDKPNSKLEKVFPNHQALLQKSLKEGKVDISSIYSLEVNSEKEKVYLLEKLRKNPAIAYAEEEVINQLSYQPNDTLNYLQWYLDAVRAFDAWDIEQGDSTVFIAITDTGSDTDHPDLEDNLYKNWNDPINGVDDDADGYVDNFYGWDVGMNDNNVNPEVHAGSNHGTNVAGIASAVTDNTAGVSGCGFNSRIMTVKIDNTLGQLVGAYSGIVYAADRGARIINCSWGSYSFSEFGRDIVNYASINRGALIICGAGNGPFNTPDPEGVEDRFYPAAYENAMAVGAIDTGDLVKRSSNYGYWLDIFAPGERMWTTYGGGNYGRNGGTSMASPVVAAAAALVLAQNPSFSNRQIQERLINSGINIDAANDPKYAGKLGPGKVDFLNALADTINAGIRFENWSYTNGKNQIIESGDSLFISGEFVNYLKNASQGTVRLSELSNSVQGVSTQKSLPALNSFDRHSIDQDPFVLVLNQQLALNQRLEFKLEITAGNYSRLQFFSIEVNNDILDLQNDKIALSLGSNGSLGYSGPTNSEGIGFTYLNGSSQLWESSFMIGNSTNYVADAFRGETAYDQDFAALSIMKKRNDDRAVVSASGIFNDAGLINPPNLEIDQYTYLYDSTYTDKAVIFNYLIKNVSGAPLSNLYAGIIADWDVVDFANNKVFYDDNYKMGISFSTDSSLYLGMSVLSHPTLANHYALDNTTGGQGGVDPTGGFTAAEKFQVLSGRRDSAGFHRVSGEDIIDAISIGPFNLAKDSTISLSFAWMVGDDLAELRELADSAKSIFERLPIGLNENLTIKSDYTIYPNPAEELLNIEIRSIEKEALILQIFDLKGRMVRREQLPSSQSAVQKYTLDVGSLKTGVYLLKIIGDKINIQDKFVISSNN